MVSAMAMHSVAFFSHASADFRGHSPTPRYKTLHGRRTRLVGGRFRTRLKNLNLCFPGPASGEHSENGRQLATTKPLSIADSLRGLEAEAAVAKLKPAAHAGKYMGGRR